MCAVSGFAGCRSRGNSAARVKTCPTTVAAMEGLGYGCPDTGLIFAINAALWTVTMPILAFGTEAQKRRYLPGLATAACLAPTAPASPKRAPTSSRMQTRAERRGDGWVLERQKDLDHRRAGRRPLPLLRHDRPSKGVLGISAFLIERDAPGFRRGS